MKGYFTLAAASWASLIALIWLLILDLVPYGNVQFWALIFFGTIALLCSMGARGDEIKRNREADCRTILELSAYNKRQKAAEKAKVDEVNEIVRSSGAK